MSLRLVLSTGKVDNDGLVDQVPDAFHKRLVSRIFVHVVVPIFARAEFHDETMRDAVLYQVREAKEVRRIFLNMRGSSYLHILDGIVLPTLEGQDVRLVAVRVDAVLL